VKRLMLLTIVVVAVVAGAIFWMKKHGGEAKAGGENAAAQKPAEEESEGPHVSRDADGNVVISMDDEAQGDLGILVKTPAAIQMSPELKGYGRVMDPAPLAALLTELAIAQAGYAASSNELTRLKTLGEQGNASPRALQTAEAAALRDRLAAQSAKDRLSLSWGKPVTEQKDPGAFIQTLTSLEAALVRIDLPLGESLKAGPDGVRISGLSGQSAEGEFLGTSTSVDPQMQGRGFLFLVKANASRLVPGEAVTGYLKIPGEPLSGVVIPREAVVRTEGAGWVYVLNTAGDAFTRIQIPLDHPTDAGWFITKGVATTNYVVVAAAQQLLSTELKGQSGGE